MADGDEEEDSRGEEEGEGGGGGGGGGEDLDEEAVDLMIKRMGEKRFEKLQEDMRSISKRFKEREEYYRETSVRPLTPSSVQLKALDDEVAEKLATNKLVQDDFREVDPYQGMFTWQRFIKKYLILPKAIHPQSNLMLVIWGIQTLSFLYNLWIIPFRVCFAIYQSESNAHIWMAMDYFMDLLYVLDMVLLKSRISFMNSDGIFESGRKRMLENYVRNGTFKQDLLSLLPLDLLYLLTGFTGPATILRAPRLLRYYHFELFFDRLDATLPYPVFIRLSRTVNVMLYLIHLNSCVYYFYSTMEGLDTSNYVFNGIGNAYIRCFFVGLKTSVSIGINPKPGRDMPGQMVFMGTLWLMGVFVFAVLIGNVKDIIAQSTQKHDEYMEKFDQISQYMYHMRVPQLTIKRVKQWCSYTWETQKSFDELAILEHLPGKMRTDVALDVHYDTIKNVKLFHGCDPGLLRELVVKLQPIIFLSGDYICRKGDVGKEMFIITVGQVQVVGGPDDSIVFVTLGTGVCFGEVALLGSGKMNRRTANVRALGYTTLYVLYKEDLNQALSDYPEDRSLLGRKALKAAKEIATKQSADQPPDEMALKRDVIVPIEKTAAEEPLPKLVKVVEEAIQKEKAEVESENVEEDREDIESLEASSTTGQQSREESSD